VVTLLLENDPFLAVHVYTPTRLELRESMVSLTVPLLKLNVRRFWVVSSGILLF